MLLAAEPALAYLRGRAVAVTPVEAASTAETLLAHFDPAAVLVGTSENEHSLGLSLVKAARACGLATAGFVDGFANASFRFRGTTSSPLAYAPDVVFVPDEPTRRAFVELGLDGSRVLVTGHPYHDDVLRKRDALEAEGVEAVRRRVLHAPRDARVITFVSELSTGFDAAQFQRSSEYTLTGRGQRSGRTEIVLEEVIDAVRACRDQNLYLVLRLHPKNTRAELGSLVDEVDHVSEGGMALEVAFASDLVVGMTSMLLVEASLLGRPTLSVVPRIAETVWLPTIASGSTPCATTREELLRQLLRWSALGLGDEAPTPPSDALGRLTEAVVALARTR